MKLSIICCMFFCLSALAQPKPLVGSWLPVNSLENGVKTEGLVVLVDERAPDWVVITGEVDGKTSVSEGKPSTKTGFIEAPIVNLERYLLRRLEIHIGSVTWVLDDPKQRFFLAKRDY